MKAGVSFLSLFLGTLKHGLFIFIIYIIRKAMISSSEKFASSSSSDPFFNQSSSEFWANEYAEEMAMLNQFTTIMIIMSAIVLLGAWIAMNIVLFRKNAVAAGIISIVFISVVGGILMLTVVRKKIAADNPKPATPNNMNFVKPTNPSKPCCAYCDRELPKSTIVCPYCGAHVTEKK